MKEVLSILLEYVITYTLVVILYLLFFVRKKTKYNKNKVPVEYQYLINLYGINKKDINYKKFMYTTAFINTFIIVTTYIIISKLLNKWIWRILIGVIILALLIIICYGLLGRYYQKRGKNKNV